MRNLLIGAALVFIGIQGAEGAEVVKKLDEGTHDIVRGWHVDRLCKNLNSLSEEDKEAIIRLYDSLDSSDRNAEHVKRVLGENQKEPCVKEFLNEWKKKVEEIDKLKKEEILKEEREEEERKPKEVREKEEREKKEEAERMMDREIYHAIQTALGKKIDFLLEDEEKEELKQKNICDELNALTPEKQEKVRTYARDKSVPMGPAMKEMNIGNWKPIIAWYINRYNPDKSCVREFLEKK